MVGGSPAPLEPASHLVQHVSGLTYSSLPTSAIEACRTFLLDTFGVGAAGAKGSNLDSVLRATRRWGRADEATVWGDARKLPAPSAAFVNGYRIHSLEFDCLHERAVLHPMAAILSAVMAVAERKSGEGAPISGKQLITAIVAGVDVATFLGFAARGPVRFFRPSTAGGLGSAAAIANLSGFDPATTSNALGIQYSHTSGTMQAHVEGSPCLGLQVGHAARSAIMSCDLAAEGFTGPSDILVGRHGYFRLFENGAFQIEGEIDRIGREFQIEELSHKPFPSGRLTHGAIHALMTFKEQVDFSVDDIAAFECIVPQLVARQVGRPLIKSPEPNYAKLCIPFVAATFLRRGEVDVDGFVGRDVLDDPAVHEIASRIVVIEDGNPDPNAMNPQRFRLSLKNGETHEIDVEHTIGHPKAPLSRDQNIGKFLRACGSGGLSDDQARHLLVGIERLESVDDVANLVTLMRPTTNLTDAEAP